MCRRMLHKLIGTGLLSGHLMLPDRYDMFSHHAKYCSIASRFDEDYSYYIMALHDYFIDLSNAICLSWND